MPSHAPRSNDLALRLREQPFVTAFSPGWRYECVWETETRQDAELILKVFRSVCCACQPLSCSGCCELMQLPIQTIMHTIDAIVDKAKYVSKSFSLGSIYCPTQRRAGRVNSSFCCACNAALARRIRPSSTLYISCKLLVKLTICCINIRLATPCTIHKIPAVAGHFPFCAPFR